MVVPFTWKTNKEGKQVEDYLEDDVQDSVLRAALIQSYSMFKVNTYFNFLKKQNNNNNIHNKIFLNCACVCL